jgi:trk system potassium uptake protein TrkA
MKRIAILGLDYFGRTLLEEIADLEVEIILIDRNRELIDEYSNMVSAAIVMDIVNGENLQKILPEKIDAVVIDMGDSLEASILATSYCKKLGIPLIVARAETEAHGEILSIVGANRIIFPNKEAAKRVAPLIISDTLLNYLPVSDELAIAEVEIPESFTEKNVVELDFRKRYNLNLIALKNEKGQFGFFTDPDYRFQKGDIALVVGAPQSIESFTGVLKKDVRPSVGRIFKKFFGNKK